MAIPRTRRDPTSDRIPVRPTPSSPTTATGGTARRSMAPTRSSPRPLAPAKTASSASTKMVCPRASSSRWPDPRGRRWPRTSGSGWLSSTRCSRSSTTPSAIGCAASTPVGPTISLYHKARLINAALMAKIHTTEWTPAIIAHPTSRYAMRATWSGIVGQHLGRRLGHLGSGELLSGIPGSKTDHHGFPYSLTEEFVAVYRMHPLVPDEFCFSSVAGGELLEKRTFPELGRSTPASASTRSASRTRSTRSGSLTRERSRCTTTRASSSTWSARTAPTWTSPPQTSSASANAGSRATTSSAGSSG